MATIYDETGRHITEGLQGCSKCDEAILRARAIAAQNNRPVILYDEDEGETERDRYGVIEVDGFYRSLTDDEWRLWLDEN
ncbi:unnamed protein product [Sphagnum tenellum]